MNGWCRPGGGDSEARRVRHAYCGTCRTVADKKQSFGLPADHEHIRVRAEGASAHVTAEQQQ
jgi:hypothetical protein